MDETNEEILRDFLESLPPALQDTLEEAVGDPDKTSDLVGAEHLFSILLSAGGEAFEGTRVFCFRLFGATLLFALLTLIFGESEDKGLSRMAESGMAIVLLLLMFGEVQGDVERIASSVLDMCHLADGLLPAYIALFAAGGSTATAATASAGFGALSLLLQNLFAGILLPLLRVLFGFTLVGVAGDGGKTGGIFRTVRGLYVTLLGFLSLLLTASLAFQSTLSAATDSLSVRSVKFALGNLIPVIGGGIAESFRTLAASLSFLRSSLGIFALVALLSMILPTLLTAFFHRLALSLAASLAAMLGAPRAEKVFLDMRGLYDLLIATVAISFVVFFLVLTVFSKCGVAIGG